MGFGSAVRSDLEARAPWYGDDWKEGFNSGFRIFAPALYIFFASVIPALAFGEQLDHDTGHTLNGVHVLTATALCGLIQAIFGGQPLLIVGVAEPIVLVYMFMYKFMEDQKKEDLFLPWATWVCIWASVFIFVLSMVGACKFIDKFTRFSGELFGMLIALLFLQQAIKGVAEEFDTFSSSVNTDPESHTQRMLLSESSDKASNEANLYHWRLVNGVWAVVLAIGLLLTALLVHTARSWRFLKGWGRTLLADYGVPIMVLVWSGVSYSLKDTPKNVPRRLSLPNTWEVTNTWKVSQRLGEVDAGLIAAAAVPGFIITALFYFDHNVSSQLAQQKEFDLKKPAAYSYDFFLLGIMTLMCGLLGIPPVNGVLPQAPMHTKSLATLKKQLKKMELKKRSALENPDPIDLGRRSVPMQKLDKEKFPKTASAQDLSNLDCAGPDPAKVATPRTAVSAQTLADGKETVAIEVKEQRLSGFIQSALVCACLAITPAIKKIPKSVLWGYFAYMAVESLPGSEFWDRILLLFTDPKKRYAMLETAHSPYLETVPFGIIVKFTLFQFAYMLIVYGITWAGIAGIFFPVAIMLLIPVRQYVMPRFFEAEHLRELDMAEYEEAPPVDRMEILRSARKSGVVLEGDDAELREKLDKEVVGDMLPQVKHHLTRDQVERRKEEVELAATLRESEARARMSTEQNGEAPPLEKDGEDQV